MHYSAARACCHSGSHRVVSHLQQYCTCGTHIPQKEHSWQYTSRILCFPTRSAGLSHPGGLRLAFVGAAEDVGAAGVLDRLALVDVHAPEVDVDAARPPERGSTAHRLATASNLPAFLPDVPEELPSDTEMQLILPRDNNTGSRFFIFTRLLVAFSCWPVKMPGCVWAAMVNFQWCAFVYRPSQRH